VTLAQLPVGLCFTPETGVGWSVSRSDIGLVSGGSGPVTRSSRSVAGGPRRVVQLPVRYVIVVTLMIFRVGLAAGRPELFRPPWRVRTGPSGPPARGHATVTKNFSEPGFESSAGWELHPTCAVLIRLPGTGRPGGAGDGPEAPGRFDGVLIAV